MKLSKDKAIKILSRYDNEHYTPATRQAHRMGAEALENIAKLEETVVHQRKRAETAETFICTMCAECEWEVNDGILVMQKACCSWFPECEKFRLRSMMPLAETPQEADNA